MQQPPSKAGQRARYLFDEQENRKQLRVSLATVNEPGNRAQSSRDVALARLNMLNRQANSGALLKHLDAIQVTAKLMTDQILSTRRLDAARGHETPRIQNCRFRVRPSGGGYPYTAAYRRAGTRAERGLRHPSPRTRLVIARAVRMGGLIWYPDTVVGCR